jgi:ABC-2 type transport system ATP-binding protein
MLNFRNITKVFKPEFLSQPFMALDDVSFSIPRGSMVGFLGANGAGKTTSLKILMDFIRPTSGSIEFSPELGKTRQEVYRRIGFLPERPYFYPNLTGLMFLRYMATLSELSTEQFQRGLKRLAPRFKIDHALERPLKTYSKGMLQRIGFLATILHDPEFIILDEPLSGLDPIGRKELKDVIIDLHREGKTVFFSSHIVPDVEEICDRVIFLKEGKLIYDGEVRTLLTRDSGDVFQLKVKCKSEDLSLLTDAKVKALPAGYYSIEVGEASKNQVLQTLLSRNVDVRSIDTIKPSLEEIFYQLKGQNA